MRKIKNILFLFLIVGASGCITEFIPETDETREMLVVEGLLTDQNRNTVKISRSFPLQEKVKSVPVSGCIVWITDDNGGHYDLFEVTKGEYMMFERGVVGRKYTLHINTSNSSPNRYSFQSFPMEMIPVPPVDTIYYQKIARAGEPPYENVIKDYCQIFIDASDPSGKCRNYRWDFTETWEFRLPFDKPKNKICWITEESNQINVKSTTGLSQSVVNRHPLHYITNMSDRLLVLYSMLVDQYSVSEEEYRYWEKIKAVTQDVGSLYDITPAAIPNNIYCLENPAENVLGYFSVSAKATKRIFIKDHFRDQPDFYTDCVHDTIIGAYPIIPNLNQYIWILDYDYGLTASPPWTSVTYTQGCGDCTTRGTTVKPPFWPDAQYQK